MADLGDISSFLKEGNVSDLSWLEVDEDEYRKEDALPKQNLDVSPDLQALWNHGDESPSVYLVPNKSEPWPNSGEVNTMGDLSEAHGRLRTKGEEIRRMARLALMQSTDRAKFSSTMKRLFDLETLKANRDVLASVLAERGLIGKVYIEAKDFPNCHNAAKQDTTFVRRHACDSKYVVAKPECGGCMHAKQGPTTGSSNCAVFHKEIVMQVPYTEQLAQAVEQNQRSLGKPVQASTGSPKERIRLALLTEAPSKPVAVYSGVGLAQESPALPYVAQAEEKLVAASMLTKKRDETNRLAMKAQPIIATLRREMLKGRTASELGQVLKVSYSVADLQETRLQWEPVFKEAGLYGSLYSTQDSFDECREGADFLAKHNPGIRAMVAGSKCGSCIYNKVSRCMLYGKPLVKAASDLYTPEVVKAVIDEHKMAGRIQPWQTQLFANEAPKDALRSIQRLASSNQPATAPTRMDIFKAYVAETKPTNISGQTRREIIRTASRFLNEGLYGDDLLGALKSRFVASDIAAAANDLRPLLAEQGLQGIFYVDAAIYDDYGKGCSEAARLHRTRNVPYVKQGSKCGSCVFQQKKGFCSVINKPLVVEPPYVDKLAQQREILASGRATETTNFANLINNGHNMIAEFEMQNTGMDIELNPSTVAAAPIGVELGRGKVKL